MKRFFSFILSFSTTFVVGFFILSVFIDYPGNIVKQVLGKTNEIGYEIFAGQVSGPFLNNDFNPDENLNQEKEENLPEENIQDLIDDIQEKIDIIQQQVNELLLESTKSEIQNLKQDENLNDKNEELENNDPETDEQNTQNELAVQESCVGQINLNTASLQDLDKIIEIGPITAQKIIDGRPFYSLNDLLKVSGIGEITLQKIKDQGCAYIEPGLSPPPAGGGGSSGSSAPAPTYPKILISEAQIKPTTQRFIELYNPNSSDVDLTGWYLQRKTATGDDYQSLVTKTDFSGKKILANSYFLISRTDPTAEILLDDLTISNENSLVLKSPDKEISDQASWAEVADNLSWCFDFELCSTTPKAQNIKYVEPIPPPLPTDTDAPQVVFDLLSPIQNTLEFSVNFTITDISSTTTPSGLSCYVFQWSEDGENWHPDDIPTIASDGLQTRNFTGADGKTYYFQVKATDVAGNTTPDWLPVEPAQTKIEIPVILKNILINEIQIEGATTKDDWVELYNPNDSDIDISQWSVQRSSKTGTFYKKNFEIDDKIVTGGYFLIVRNDASQELLDIADMTCSMLQLSSDGTLYLVKNQEEILDESDIDIIDKVGWGEAFGYETSPASIPEKNQSITRTGGADTDDNSVDFTVIDTPTPKAL